MPCNKASYSPLPTLQLQENHCFILFVVLQQNLLLTDTHGRQYTSDFTEQNRLENPVVTQSNNSLRFMKPKFLLPCSQQPKTGP